MKPIIKWVGGKARLLDRLMPLLPEHRTQYIEPFFGGGALFFATNNTKAILNDRNPELINLYEQVAMRPTFVHVFLQKLQREDYYDVRARFNAGQASQLMRAAMFIYLNKTCFNGVWRVNRDGRFNVPKGDYKQPVFPTLAELEAAAVKLRDATLLNEDFSVVVQSHLRKGGFVYLDPPYVPVSESANFTSYTKDSFGAVDFERLRELCAFIDRKGAKFMLSNSYTPQVLKAFRRYHVTEISRTGSINSNTNKRGSVVELVIRNYR